MAEFEKPIVGDSNRFERVFGVRLPPMAEAGRATLAWYGAHPNAGGPD